MEFLADPRRAALPLRDAEAFIFSEPQYLAAVDRMRQVEGNMQRKYGLSGRQLPQDKKTRLQMVKDSFSARQINEAQRMFTRPEGAWVEALLNRTRLDEAKTAYDLRENPAKLKKALRGGGRSVDPNLLDDSLFPHKGDRVMRERVEGPMRRHLANDVLRKQLGLQRMSRRNVEDAQMEAKCTEMEALPIANSNCASALYRPVAPKVFEYRFLLSEASGKLIGTPGNVATEKLFKSVPQLRRPGQAFLNVLPGAAALALPG